MVSTSILANKHGSLNSSNRYEIAKKTCTILFYCSLSILAMSYFFSTEYIQIVVLLACVALGIAMVLSYKQYFIGPIYLFNLAIVFGIAAVPYQNHAFDISVITFIPLLICNRLLLQESRHFWYLAGFIVTVALGYIFFANVDGQIKDLFVDGVIFLINVFVIIKVLNYTQEEKKTQRIAISEALEFLQKITDINPHLIFAKSREGKFTFVNKYFAEKMGKTKEEIVGKTDFELGVSKEDALLYLSKDLEVIDSGKKAESYLELVDKDGKLSYEQSIRAPLINKDGHVTGVLGISIDRSEEKRYENKLVDQKLLYQTLFDNLNDAVIVYDYNKEKICSLNETALKMFEFPANYTLDDYTRFDLFPGEINGVNIEEGLSEHRDMIVNNKSIKGKGIMKRLSGELFDCTVSVFPSPGQDAEGIVVIKDVSIESKAKSEILKSKDYFMQIYNSSPIAISLTNIETMKVSDINNTYQKLLGYSLSDLQVMDVNEYLPNVDLQEQYKIVDELKERKIDKSVLERNYVKANGNKIKVRTSQSIIEMEGQAYLLEFIENITETAKEKARYKFLFENAFDGIAVTDAEKKTLVDSNSKFKDFFELGQSFDSENYRTLDFSPQFQDDGTSSADSFHKYYKHVKEFGSIDFNWKFLLKNGDTKYADVSLIHSQSEGEPLTYSIYKDTTNERLIQNALRESEKRFRLIFDNAFDGLYFFNYKTEKLVLANRRLYELFESSPDRLLIDKPHLKPEFQPDGSSTLEKIQKTFYETLEKGKSRANRIYVKSDGTIVHLEISTFLLSPPDDDIIVSIYKDITDQKRAEDALIVNATQEEKLDALGRELSSYTLFTTQKNRLLTELSEDLRLLTTLEKNESKIFAEKIRRKIANNLDEKENWLSFKVQFERVHPGFFNLLEKKYGNLTTNDLKHCAYIKMGLSNSEIADILFVGKKAIEMSHYRLKKKLEIDKELSLKQALQDSELTQLPVR